MSGWVDGGTAATGSVQYLVGKLQAKVFAEIPVSRFHVYQLPGQEHLRPSISIKDGLLVEHTYPNNTFSYARNAEGSNDLILFLGTEPSLNWEEYAANILRLAKGSGVVRIYWLGGVLDRCPHTKEPKVSCACSSPEVKQEMEKYAVTYSDYEGPGRIGYTLLDLCQKRAVEMVAMTTRATYYPEHNVMIPYNPKSIRALVKRLNHMLGLELSLEDLNEMVRRYEDKVNFTVSQSDKFKSYITELEKNYEEVVYEEPLDLLGEEAVEMVQEFLQDDKPGS